MNSKIVALKTVRSCLELLPNGRDLYQKVSHSRAIHRLLPTKHTYLPTKLRNGIPIAVDVTDYNGRMIYLYGLAYPETIETCRSFLNEGDVFLDIGANYGVVGLMCHDVVGKGGKIHLFEPQPELCSKVSGAVESSGLNNVVLHKVGLMDRDGSLEMSCVRNHTGKGSFILGDHQAKGQTVDKLTLEVKDISTYLPPLLSNRKFGAKVDVEGAELLILPWLFKQDNLRFLVFENRHIPSDKRSLLFEEINRQGFSIFGIDNRHSKTMLCPINNDPSGRIDYLDVLCLRRGNKHVFTEPVALEQLCSSISE